MAKEIGPIAKPFIRLVGNVIAGTNNTITGFNERVDHARFLNPTSTDVISGVTAFDQDELLTFDKRVRIIITSQVSPRRTYVRESGELSSLEFEGSQNTNASSINQYAETYYTLNGKDPVRTAATLYTYKEYSSQDDLSANPLDVHPIGTQGFVLSASPTGGDFITIKAKTYQLGNESRVAVARFKIAQLQGTLEFENRDSF